MLVKYSRASCALLHHGPPNGGMEYSTSTFFYEIFKMERAITVMENIAFLRKEVTHKHCHLFQ